MVNTHRNLCESLAEHCARSGDRAYVELRPAAWQSRPTGIPDVLAMGRFAYGERTWKLIAYEVKVSRADFQRDVKAGKWMRYVSELGIQRVMFATPKGLIPPDEIPKEAGLIVYDEAKATWRVSRTGRVLQNDITKVSPNLLLAMLDNPPIGTLGRIERSVMLRERVRYFEDRLGEIQDEDFRSFANALGHEFATRVSAKRKDQQEVVAIEAWAQKALELIATVLDRPLEEVKAEVVRGYAQPIVDLIERARRATDRVEEIHKVAEFLESLTDCRHDESWHLKHRREAAAPIIQGKGAA